MGQGAGRPEQQHQLMIGSSNNGGGASAYDPADNAPASSNPGGGGSSTSDNNDDIGVVRTQIEQTRAEMSETIEAIKAKLDPHILVEHAKETVREATVGRAEEAVGQAVDTARDAADHVKDTAKNVFGSAKQAVGSAFSSTRDVLDTTLGSARESTSGLFDSARTVARDAGERVKEAGTTVADTVREKPLPIAATGVGLVLLVAAAGIAARGRPSPAIPSAAPSNDVTMPPDLAAAPPVTHAEIETIDVRVQAPADEWIAATTGSEEIRQYTPQPIDGADPAAKIKLADSLVIGGALAVLIGSVTYGVVRRVVAP